MGTVTDSGRNIYAAVKSFPSNIIKLPCAAHCMNAVMKELFVEVEIKIKTNKTVNFFDYFYMFHPQITY